MAILNSSNVVNGNTIQSTDILQLYNAFTSGGGYSVSISGSLTGSATSASYASASFSASFAISSSRAVTSSYALTAFTSTTSTTATTAGAVSSIIAPSGSVFSGTTFGFAAGSITMTGSIGTTSATGADNLKSKVLGTSLFINATIFNTSTAGNIVAVRSYNPTTGVLQFQTSGGTGTEFVLWTAFYVP
jgi:hypothetical protein